MTLTQDHRDPIIICKQEEKINEISENVIETKGEIKSLNLRINGALEKIANHMTEGEGYRRLIVGTAISLVLSILGGIVTVVTLAYHLGAYTRQISVNTERLNIVEQDHKDHFYTKEK